MRRQASFPGSASERRAQAAACSSRGRRPSRRTRRAKACGLRPSAWTTGRPSTARRRLPPPVARRRRGWATTRVAPRARPRRGRRARGRAGGGRAGGGRSGGGRSGAPARLVEDAVHEEAARARHARDELGEVGGAPRRQGPQRRRLGAHPGLAPPVPPRDQLVDEGPALGERGEVALPSQDQGLVEGGLGWRWRDSTAPFSWASPGLALARDQPVVRAELVAAARGVLGRLAVEVAVGGREAAGRGARAARRPGPTGRPADARPAPRSSRRRGRRRRAPSRCGRARSGGAGARRARPRPSRRARPRR